MRAGQMDRLITLQGVTTADTDSGAVTETWSTVATFRAQLVSAAVEELQRDMGNSTEIAVTFRTRWFRDVRLSDRIVFGVQVFNITQIKEIGRRRGLEIKAVRVGAWKKDVA
jgi:head-tail adaptor